MRAEGKGEPMGESFEALPILPDGSTGLSQYKAETSPHAQNPTISHPEKGFAFMSVISFSRISPFSSLPGNIPLPDDLSCRYTSM